MSQLLITQYHNELDKIKKVSGNHRETIVREAFKHLLKQWGEACNLVFIAEYPMSPKPKTRISLDGALLYELRLAHGFWEAKDQDDDLDAEIAAKFAKGYPQDNILFTDDATAVLIQHKQEVMRIDMRDGKALARLLECFFAFEIPVIADFRAAVEQFKSDLPAVLQALRDKIELAAQQNIDFQATAHHFLEHIQSTINPSLQMLDVREMLIQHILTEEIFSKVFDDSDFHQQNNIAKQLYSLEKTFFIGSEKKQTLKSLEAYYSAIRSAAAEISSHAEKQHFLKVIYENFYKVYNTRAADRLGVVYTPNEIVKFMIDGADWLCEQHFGKNLADQGVEILDPATGTGTFMCELLEHFRGNPKALSYKYQHELHANEVAILPYYVANLNIEATYAALTGQYAEYENLCFVDTLDNVGEHTQTQSSTRDMFGFVSEENVKRIKRQNEKKISVVIGNPPYNANQLNENDNNKNREYPTIDQRIKQTYIASSTAQKTKLYDMYARFFRWACDRLQDQGIVAFVTNRSFIESRTFDGFRACVAQEFSDIYVVDLGGDIRQLSGLDGIFLNEKHTIFGKSAAVGIAIAFFVKKETPRQAAPATPLKEGNLKSSTAACDIPLSQRGTAPARGGVKRASIYYKHPCDIRATRDEKIAYLRLNPLHKIPFDRISPDAKHNWLNLTDNDFESHLPIANKDTKAGKAAANAIFKLFSLGVVTNRDEWAYDFSPSVLSKKMNYLINVYNSQNKTGINSDNVSDLVDYKIKWTRAVKNDLVKGVIYQFSPASVVPSLYRPFVKKQLYFSKQLNEMRYQMPSIFGESGRQENTLIMISGTSSNKPFQTLASDILVDLHTTGDTQCLPRYVYDKNGNRVDNITDWALSQFAAHYGEPITKDAIFNYCYAVLHSPTYRQTYVQNLKRDFPHIPLYGKHLNDFWHWANLGEQLMNLHIHYEQHAPYPLERIEQSHDGKPLKVLLRANQEAGTIDIDSTTRLRGVPPGAWKYKLGNRSALEWVLDQYKPSTPKDPTIREQFNDYQFADYKETVIDLLMRVCAVSVATIDIEQQLKQKESKHD